MWDNFGHDPYAKNAMIETAARKVLSSVGIGIKDIKAIKTHSPFAVNDVYFCREMGIKLEDMNNYGCSLIWGHPQGPTGVRLIIELIEELVIKEGDMVYSMVVQPEILELRWL